MKIHCLAGGDALVLSELVQAAEPFVQIVGGQRIDWQRVMKDADDGRIGPWKWRAEFNTLDAKTWSRKGEALYLVVDGFGAVRAVGQTTDRIKTRWKEVPMFSLCTGLPLGQRGLFHTTCWPAIEAELDKGTSTTYVVSAIFRDELIACCRRVGGPLADALLKPESHRKRLSYHVETWVCGLKRLGLPLWNVQKT